MVKPTHGLTRLTRTFDKERALGVLLEGAFVGDKAAGSRAGMHHVTVSGWRKRLSEDAEFRAEYEKRLAICREEWRAQAPAALTASMKAVESMALHIAENPGEVGAELFSTLVTGIQLISKVIVSQRYADVRLEHLQRQLDAPAENLNYLPDVKQIEAYKPSENGHNGNGHVNGQVIEAEVVRDENDPIS